MCSSDAHIIRTKDLLNAQITAHHETNAPKRIRCAYATCKNNHRTLFANSSILNYTTEKRALFHN